MLRRAWSNLEEAAIAVSLTAVLLLVVAGVVSRYFIHESISFTEELTRYLFVWATFLGVSAAVKHRAHLGLSALVDRLPTRARSVIGVLATIACIVFFATLTAAGVLVVKLQMQTAQTTPSLGAPMWWMGLAIPVGGGLTVVRLVETLLRRDHGEVASTEA